MTLLDAFSRNHGKGRHLWISVSRELVQDAKRDLSDIGCHVAVHDGAEVLDQMSSGSGKKGKGLGAGGSLAKGVLFITYSLLVSGKRVEDIVGWLSGAASAPRGTDVSILERNYSGVIVFDEAHKAKNLESDTRTAKLVLALQDRLPNARVLYCSATGVSDIKHMVYASRLGLWGSANPLYPTFESFQSALAKRGVGAMEMLALEMKRKGIFLARTLSWDGAEFNTLEVQLSDEQVTRYDGAGECSTCGACCSSMLPSVFTHAVPCRKQTNQHSPMVVRSQRSDRSCAESHGQCGAQEIVVKLLVGSPEILSRNVHLRQGKV